MLFNQSVGAHAEPLNCRPWQNCCICWASFFTASIKASGSNVIYFKQHKAAGSRSDSTFILREKDGASGAHWSMAAVLDLLDPTCTTDLLSVYLQHTLIHQVTCQLLFTVLLFHIPFEHRRKLTLPCSAPRVRPGFIIPSFLSSPLLQSRWRGTTLRHPAPE